MRERTYSKKRKKDEKGGYAMKNFILAPKSRFLRISCPKCRSKQVVFGCAASRVVCKKCGNLLVEPTGGKSKIKAKVLEVLE